MRLVLTLLPSYYKVTRQMQNQISRGEEQIAVLFWHGVICEGCLCL